MWLSKLIKFMYTYLICLFKYDFQVDVWALGVSAIEMAEVYPLLVFLILHLPSKLLVYPMWITFSIFFPFYAPTPTFCKVFSI